VARGHYHQAMPSPDLPFSLLDAARVVARGGSLDEKLRALSVQAAAAARSGAVAVLLLDADADVLVAADGSASVPLQGADAGLIAAVQDRLPTVSAGPPAGLATLLPDARSSLVLPLLTEDDEGAAVQGVMVVTWTSPEPPHSTLPEALMALADLMAVAIHQARLENTALEQSDHADRLHHTDRLTGLANRITFERMLELEIARATRQGTPLAVAIFDVDGLTAISEHSGARVADLILRHIAAAIADRVRLLDTVARFGDDEFVVIAPGDAGGLVALRMRDAVRELTPVGGHRVSVSAAVVHHPADGATGADLVAAAEAAIARARAAGPGAVLGVQEALA
jgi:diguanylate cyclase (GGDEF)-like protein